MTDKVVLVEVNGSHSLVSSGLTEAENCGHQYQVFHHLRVGDLFTFIDDEMSETIPTG